MAIEKVPINIDKVILKGGHDSPPKKKKDEDEDETKIPQSENDVDGLTYIEE